MPTPRSTAELYRAGQRQTAAALISTAELWDQVDVGSIVQGWSRVRDDVVAQLAATQVAAARSGATYVPQVLDELGLAVEATATVSPGSLVGGSSGVPLGEVLDRVPLRALHAVKQGYVDEAKRRGADLLEGIVRTHTSDAARLASSLAIVSTPTVTGYVRMLNPPSCSRCVVLAGRFYRWNQGFRRHPRCDCRHIPSTEDMAGDLRTDPAAYFSSLSRAEQDRIFTEAGARAVRDGADLGQVVNARRGLNVAGGRVYGQNVRTTTEGTTARASAARSVLETQIRPGQRYRRTRTPRLMPESIYEIATDRDDALRLLRRFGYIT